jgi:two-component system, NtrC family, response regulator AtoC
MTRAGEYLSRLSLIGEKRTHARADAGQRNLSVLLALSLFIMATSTMAAQSEASIESSPAMIKVAELVARVAPSNLSVIVVGETGVGKELIARAVHRLSPRASRPFVAVNCAAFTESLIDSELFGHEKSAFTGAVGSRVGLLEACQGGSVFLDEVGELSLTAQAKLLRALEVREVRPVGSTTARRIDVRFIAATNRDLRAEEAQGRFRADLRYRLDGMTISVPPLRERRDEIPQLARHFVEELSRLAGRAKLELSDEAIRVLVHHDWPGNVRELRSAIERAVILCDALEIKPEDLLLEPAGESHAVLRLGATGSERERIVEALDACAGSQTRAALLLGISRRSLITKLDFYEIPRPRKAAIRPAPPPHVEPSLDVAMGAGLAVERRF